MDFYLLTSFSTILDQSGFDIPAIIQVSDQTIQKIKYVSGFLQNSEVQKNGVVFFSFSLKSVFLHGDYEKELKGLLEAWKNNYDFSPSSVTPRLVESNLSFDYAISNPYITVNTKGLISIEFTAYCSDAIPEDALFTLSKEMDVGVFLKLFKVGINI